MQFVNLNEYRARNLKFATSKILVNCMTKMMICLEIDIFAVQKALIYCTFIKSHLNLFILLVFPHVANFRYVANFRFHTLSGTKRILILTLIQTRNSQCLADFKRDFADTVCTWVVQTQWILVHFVYINAHDSLAPTQWHDND